jgi:hypothetical protein
MNAVADPHLNRDLQIFSDSQHRPVRTKTKNAVLICLDTYNLGNET